MSPQNLSPKASSVSSFSHRSLQISKTSRSRDLFHSRILLTTPSSKAPCRYVHELLNYCFHMLSLIAARRSVKQPKG